MDWSESDRIAYSQERTECIEEPPMAIDFLLILLLQAEQNLRRYYSLIWVLKVEILIQTERSCVLKDMSMDMLVVDEILHKRPVLVHAKER